jgi:hypothetical protein
MLQHNGGNNWSKKNKIGEIINQGWSTNTNFTGKICSRCYINLAREKQPKKKKILKKKK